MFYLDHNATTRMCPQAIDAMSLVQKQSFGNASSVHGEGEAARSCLNAARAAIVGMIGCESRELYFTSGGTESNNWAAYKALGRHTVYGAMVSQVEHKSMLNAVEAYTYPAKRSHYLPVDGRGVLDMDYLEGALKEAEGACFVSVMLANNETGVIQDVQSISRLVRKYRGDSVIHTDACQAFGKIPVNVDDLEVDLMSLSAHKLGGPKGIGALYVREGLDIAPMIHGGHQEHDRRAGTENVAGAVGFYVAARARLDRMNDWRTTVSAHCAGLLEILLHDLPYGLWVNGGDALCIPNTLNVGFFGVDASALTIILSNLGIAVSTGSACEAGRPEGSHVLKAMGQSEEVSRSAIRFSFSDDLQEGAIPIIGQRIIDSVKALQGVEQISL